MGLNREQRASWLAVRAAADHEARPAAQPRSPGRGTVLEISHDEPDRKSATMALDLYGHLFGDRLDIVADAMDAARTAALARVAHWLPSASVIERNPVRQASTAQ